MGRGHGRGFCSGFIRWICPNQRLTYMNGLFLGMKKLCLACSLSCLAVTLSAAERFADRFVWIFGWNLEKDSDVTEISRVLETAGQHHFNGAVVSLGLDTLCKHSADYFRRLEDIRKCCDTNGLELIPSLFSVGYGGGALAHNPNLAEGLPVQDAPFLVAAGEGR